MRAQIISDDHFEFLTDEHRALRLHYLDLIDPTADLLIKAGDVEVANHRDTQYRRAIWDICQLAKQVVYVPGNHDYYGRGTFELVDGMLATLESELPNFKVLRTGFPWEFQGMRFLGDTMWHPNSTAMYLARTLIADSAQIRGWPDWILDRNQEFLAWLYQDLRPGDVVVTHHLPSGYSTPPQFRGSLTDAYFVCNVETLLRDRQPAYWIHGHTHSRCEYSLFATKVICNPMGYPSENVPETINPSVFELKLPAVAAQT